MFSLPFTEKMDPSFFVVIVKRKKTKQIIDAVLMDP